MDILQVLILSLVEGVTEFLPISSTGHLVLSSRILGIPQTEFLKSFEIIIQLGAILSVILFYWKKLLTDFGLWKRVSLAFLPTALIGFLFYGFIKEELIGNELITVVALFIGGVLLIVLEKIYLQKETPSNLSRISLKQAFGIGFIQSFSIIPGVSRAGASIMGGLFLGLNRKSAAEFSFLLAIPTMIGATGLDLVKIRLNFNQQELLLLCIGFIGSFIVAAIVIKWFIRFVETHSFIWFGIYRIIISVIYWVLFLR